MINHFLTNECCTYYATILADVVTRIQIEL